MTHCHSLLPAAPSSPVLASCQNVTPRAIWWRGHPSVTNCSYLGKSSGQCSHVCFTSPRWDHASLLQCCVNKPQRARNWSRRVRCNNCMACSVRVQQQKPHGKVRFELDWYYPIAMYMLSPHSPEPQRTSSHSNLRRPTSISVRKKQLHDIWKDLNWLVIAIRPATHDLPNEAFLRATRIHHRLGRCPSFDAYPVNTPREKARTDLWKKSSSHGSFRKTLCQEPGASCRTAPGQGRIIGLFRQLSIHHHYYVCTDQRN